MADNSAPPAARDTEEGVTIEPDNSQFSGIVFKIQANMNPKHRDRIAFLRVLSGRFERGMEVQIGRNKEKLKLSKPHTFMAQERAIVEEAWPGDIVGLYDPGKLEDWRYRRERETDSLWKYPQVCPGFLWRARTQRSAQAQATRYRS